MAWEKPTPKTIELFESVLPVNSKIERKKVFGCPVGFVNGNMFAAIHENNIVLRLADADREMFKKQYRAKAFEPLPGRVMKDWIVVPTKIVGDKKSLTNWTGEAFAYTSSLPAKVKKPKKKTKK